MHNKVYFLKMFELQVHFSVLTICYDNQSISALTQFVLSTYVPSNHM